MTPAALKRVDKHCLKQGRAELKDFERLCNTDFACEADALKALARFERTLWWTPSQGQF
ncbi:hypothetical protein [Thiorhodococcus mannitoliphagus]|uniref:hypothetical protein n=1 Tax=Thiorhodococcus mannitoliphagus TaxID=329406 RepID=UPI0013DF4D30|nr:hypothetical protein [Thiorhodococcus mannitoliphagus]